MVRQQLFGPARGATHPHHRVHDAGHPRSWAPGRPRGVRGCRRAYRRGVAFPHRCERVSPRSVLSELGASVLQFLPDWERADRGGALQALHAHRRPTLPRERGPTRRFSQGAADARCTYPGGERGAGGVVPDPGRVHAWGVPELGDQVLPRRAAAARARRVCFDGCGWRSRGGEACLVKPKEQGVVVVPARPPSPDRIRSVSVFFPAHNEEAAIAQTLEQAEKVLTRLGLDYEIIVVNDGSRDRTAEIVEGICRRHTRIRLVNHATNLGYGAAVW